MKHKLQENQMTPTPPWQVHSISQQLESVFKAVAPEVHLVLLFLFIYLFFLDPSSWLLPFYIHTPPCMTCVNSAVDLVTVK